MHRKKNEEIQMEDLEQAPPKFEDTQPQVNDPMKEVNLGIVEAPRITYISFLLPFDFKEGIIETLQEFKDCVHYNNFLIRLRLKNVVFYI